MQLCLKTNLISLAMRRLKAREIGDFRAFVTVFYTGFTWFGEYRGDIWSNLI